MLVGPDGYGRLDVRAQFTTEDSAILYMSYLGIVQMNDVVQKAVGAGQGTRYEDQYFRTALRIETGSPGYAWVNQSLFVAEGHFLEGPGVEYKVHRVT